MARPEDFFDFITDCTAERFLKSRSYIVAHGDYDGYSSDDKLIAALLDAGKFDEASKYISHNSLLSPRAHMYRR